MIEYEVQVCPGNSIPGEGYFENLNIGSGKFTGILCRYSE